MATRALSCREEEIVNLCIEGLTNEAIAQRLNISPGTVNTYWLRIKSKVGGSGRTATVARIIKERADTALEQARREKQRLADLIDAKSNLIMEMENSVLEFKAALTLLHLMMDRIDATVWATDKNLLIHLIENGELPSNQFGIDWSVGKTVREVFQSIDQGDVAVAAHLAAIEGDAQEVLIECDCSSLLLRVLPLSAESGEKLGCISILNTTSN